MAAATEVIVDSTAEMQVAAAPAAAGESDTASASSPQVAPGCAHACCAQDLVIVVERNLTNNKLACGYLADDREVYAEACNGVVALWWPISVLATPCDKVPAHIHRIRYTDVWASVSASWLQNDARVREYECTYPHTCPSGLGEGVVVGTRWSNNTCIARPTCAPGYRLKYTGPSVDVEIGNEYVGSVAIRGDHMFENMCQGLHHRCERCPDMAPADLERASFNSTSGEMACLPGFVGSPTKPTCDAMGWHNVAKCEVRAAPQVDPSISADRLMFSPQVGLGVLLACVVLAFVGLCIFWRSRRLAAQSNIHPARVEQPAENPEATAPAREQSEPPAAAPQAQAAAVAPGTANAAAAAPPQPEVQPANAPNASPPMEEAAPRGELMAALCDVLAGNPLA